MGDVVPTNQYVIRTLGSLEEGYGSKADNNMYHGGTIFHDAASKYIHVKIRSHWELKKLFNQNSSLRSDYGSRQGFL